MKEKLESMMLIFAVCAGISACGGYAHTDKVHTDSLHADILQRPVIHENGEQKYQAPTDKAQKTDGNPTAERKYQAQQTKSGKKNWMLNAGFEKNDISMWKLSYQGEANPTKIQNARTDAKSGVNSLHFYSEKKQNFKITQTVSGLAKGTYTASVYIQGKDVGRFARIYLYAIIDGKVKRSKSIKLTDWGKWHRLKIKRLQTDGKTDLTIGMKVKCAGGGQGTIDDFALIRAD